MSIDLEKLTPAPWVYDERVGQANVFAGEPPECLLRDTPPLIASHQGKWEEGEGWRIDPKRCADLKFIALARNAFDVMMRRRWGVRVDGEGWNISGTLGMLPDDGGFNAWLSDQNWPDPFTALVSADAWYKEHVENNQA